MNYKIARGYLSSNERQYLYELAKEAATIINVGIEYGASIFAFVEGSKQHTKIIAIDLIGNDKFGRHQPAGETGPARHLLRFY